MSNTIQATPGAFRDEVVERLKDPKVVPLFIACDVVMGEMSALADYFVPDTNPFESFGVVTQEGYWAGRGNAVRWQALEPGSARIASDRYASYEAFICDVAKACGLPGFGEDAIAAADGTLYLLEDACDFFLKAVANLAYDTDPVEDIAPDEVKMQGLDELPSRWRDSVSDPRSCACCRAEAGSGLSNSASARRGAAPMRRTSSRFSTARPQAPRRTRKPGGSSRARWAGRRSCFRTSPL